jgi:HSP20 family protein
MPDDTSRYDRPNQAPHDVNADTEGGELRRWVIVRHATIWHPPTDVYESNDRLIVVVEMAGMRDNDFHVVLQGPHLMISGVRQRSIPPDSAYHQLEIPFGEFRTEVSLPWPVARDAVSASYHDGFLRIELPHAPAQRIQIVNVEDEETAEIPSEPDNRTLEE